MWESVERTLSNGDTYWIVMHRQTGAFLQVGKRIADPVLFDTKRDAEFVCRAMAKASYR